MRFLARGVASCAALVVAGTFAFRPGLPGLHHDWIWPQDGHAFVRVFVESFSPFSGHGYGGGGGTPSVNAVLLFCAVLGALGVPAAGILFAFVAGALACAQLATEALLAELVPTLGRTERAVAASWYAFGPVLFQKLVAGHVYYVLAYALLPLVARCAWRGTRDGRLGPFVGAGLAIAASSGQVQFLCFDAFVVLAIVAHRPRVRTLAYAACAIGLGALHNGNAIAAALGASPDVSLARFHATVQWELDQSAHPLDLMPLGGYVGYDRAALAGPLLAVYDLARYGIVALACLSLVRYRAAHVVVFSVIALAALAIASGAYGPFSAFVPTLVHAPLFALARELWHVMALYALALVVLAATGLAELPARARIAVGAGAALVALPFLALGLPREVPAVPATALRSRAAASATARGAFVAERPLAEPLSLAGDVSAGVDPARLRDDVLSAGDPPPIVRVALLASVPDHALLADLGIAAVSDRPALVSRLGESFEPHVGADPEPWRANEARLRGSPPVVVAGARTALSLEPPGARGALDATLADADVPSGLRIALESSYADDDVDRSWVSGRGWWWQFPTDERLASDAVFTRGAQAYPLVLPRDATGRLDVLLAGGAPRLGRLPGAPLGAAGDGRYAWYAWPRARSGDALAIAAPGRGVRAIAAIVANADPTWRPAVAAPISGVRMPLPTRVARVDAFEALLPPSAQPRTLVLARAYSPGWRLRLGAAPGVPARRVHGLFAGWTIPPSRTPRRVRIVYAPARLSDALVAVASCTEILVVAGCAIARLRRARELAA